jgi:hypothetical protein
VARAPVRCVLLTAAAAVALCCASCGGGKKFYPVHGRVLANGKPAEGVTIVLHPVDDPDPKPVQPTGVVQADGSFELKSFLVDQRVVKDGAPAGKYLVTCIWWPADRSKYGPESMPDKLHNKYSSPKTSGLQAEVPEGPTELPTFELTYQP